MEIPALDDQVDGVAPALDDGCVRLANHLDDQVDGVAPALDDGLCKISQSI